MFKNFAIATIISILSFTSAFADQQTDMIISLINNEDSQIQESFRVDPDNLGAFVSEGDVGEAPIVMAIKLDKVDLV